MDSYFAAREARHKELRKELRAAWKPLAKRIKHIEIEYDGGGDSGAIERITFFDGKNEEIAVQGEQAKKLCDLLDTYWDVVLPFGWEDNDGGFGTISLEWASQSIAVEHNDRFIHHETTKIHEALEA